MMCTRGQGVGGSHAVRVTAGEVAGSVTAGVSYDAVGSVHAPIGNTAGSEASAVIVEGRGLGGAGYS
eukprot:2709471-Rhodomonas_salina.1